MIIKNKIESPTGSINCLVLIGTDWHPHTIDDTNEYETHESSDWPDIKPCPQSEKDAHALREAITQATNQVQTMLDTEAQTRGYDNINAIGKYIGYDNAFRVECEALGAWTAACWAKCYELQSGGVMPSDLLAEMPKLEE